MPDPAQVAAELSKLEGALESYLALGSDTPLAGQAKNWLDEVRQERDTAKAEGDNQDSKPDRPGEEGSSPSNFRDARKAAGDAMRNGTLRSDDGGTKTSEEEQSLDEEGKKKRTKAY